MFSSFDLIKHEYVNPNEYIHQTVVKQLNINNKCVKQPKLTTLTKIILRHGFKLPLTDIERLDQYYVHHKGTTILQKLTISQLL